MYIRETFRLLLVASQWRERRMMWSMSIWKTFRIQSCSSSNIAICFAVCEHRVCHFCCCVLVHVECLPTTLLHSKTTKRTSFKMKEWRMRRNVITVTAIDKGLHTPLVDQNELQPIMTIFITLTFYCAHTMRFRTWVPSGIMISLPSCTTY